MIVLLNLTVVRIVLPAVAVVVGLHEVVGKAAVALCRDVILGIVILMAVKVNLNVRMILPVANVAAGAMKLVERLEVVL